MTKPLSWASFTLGALVVLWMGTAFMGGNLLALIIIGAIAGVFCLGFSEQVRYQKDSRLLAQNIANTNTPVEDFSHWCSLLPQALQTPVRQRITQERSQIPTPVLTPYLIGLLVMLGLIGTFIGMVGTLKGAVIALESNTELEAIRSGLAAPMKGLGLAFGTSVAGVAASAALGLINTLSRRERLAAWHGLEAKIDSHFQGFAVSSQRALTYRAMQSQSEQWPNLLDRFDSLATRLEGMGNQLGQQLTEQQNQAIKATGEQISDLVQAVKSSLATTATEVGQQVTDAVSPAVDRLLQESQNQLSENYNQWRTQAQAQLDSQLQAAKETTQALQSTWVANHQANTEQLSELQREQTQWLQQTQEQHAANLAQVKSELASTLQNWLAQRQAQEQAQAAAVAEAQRQVLNTLTQGQHQYLELLNQQKDQCEALAQSVAAGLDKTQSNLGQQLSQWLEQQAQVAQSRMEAIEQANEQVFAAIRAQQEHQRETHKQQSQHARDQQQALNQAITSSQAELTTAINQWLGENQALVKTQLTNLEQHNQASFNELTQQLAEHSKATALQQTELLNATQAIVAGGEALLEGRQAQERQWAEQQQQLAKDISAKTQQAMTELAQAESERSQQVASHFDALQQAMAKQLTALTESLQNPMAELMTSAAESPKAAAEVLAQLRAEMSAALERDNQMLAERQGIMQQLDDLATSLAETSSQQRDAIIGMAEASGKMLAEVSDRFGARIDADIDKLTEGVAQVAASSIDLATLAETFSHAVDTYQTANGELLEHFNRLEAQILAMSDRSDEQMGYYVAQAREIIDHSLSSQQEMIEQLRRLGRSTAEAQ